MSSFEEYGAFWEHFLSFKSSPYFGSDTNENLPRLYLGVRKNNSVLATGYAFKGSLYV